MQPLGLALVGAGRMGQVHARALAALLGVDLLWVIDPRPEAARALAASLGAEASGDLQRALSDPRVGGVVVATPTPDHAATGAAVARAGKPLFLEKPIAQDLEAGRQLVRAVQEAGVPAQVGFQRRFDPAYLRAKSHLTQGRLGRLWTFRAVGRDPGPIPLAFLRSSGGVFLDMAIHDLDTARWLMGEVAEVRAIGGAVADPALAEYGLADTAVATLRFLSGALGTVEVSWRNAYGYEVRAEVVGERGKLSLEVDRSPELNLYDATGGHFERPSGFEARFERAYQAELAAFVDGIRRGAPLSPDPVDALASLELALAAQRALETGEAVALTPPERGA